MGVADPSNISSKLREGYEPCKAEDYPELMMHAAIEGRFKGGIELVGCCSAASRLSSWINAQNILQT
jgi:hypothetical protein